MPYERRRPENSTLHRVVRENLKTLYAATEDGEAGATLPAFVRKELEGYPDRGLRCRGFAVLACSTCHERRLVAFSGKARAFPTENRASDRDDPGFRKRGPHTVVLKRVAI